MIVKEYKIKNTTIKINDESFRSDEEIKEIIKRIEVIAVREKREN